MGIRIQRLRVNRGGPLQADFELEPKDVNLVFGHNETGKSYIVEAIIGFLFRTGRSSAINWGLRDWEFAGNVVVAGLEQNPVKFVRGGKKIDDYWGQDVGLPQDFARLLIVKEGETVLTDAREGANRDILKNYLSGEGLLDKLEARISATLQGASIDNRRISGNRRGEIKDREELLQGLQQLDELLEKAELAYTSGTIRELRIRKELLETELGRFEHAKRHRAKCLHDRVEILTRKKHELPTQAQVSVVDSQISMYEDKKIRCETKSAALTKLQRPTEDFAWAEQALQVYQDITGGKGVARSKSLWVVLIWISLAAAILTGFLGFPTLAAICAVGALGLFLYHFSRMQRAVASASSNDELERLSAEFKSRFGVELTDQALLRTRTEQLRESYIRARAIEEELRDTLLPELRRLEHDITVGIKRFTGRESQVQEAREAVDELRKEVEELDNKLASLVKELAYLGVREEEFLAEDPGIAWNAVREEETKQQLRETSGFLTAEEQSLGKLRARIAQETRSDSGDWEELIAALRRLREQEAERYRRLTAEILAKAKLYAAIGEFRQEENVRIALGLESEELSGPLYAITGRYRRMRHDEEEGLILITDDDEEYPLREASTGAREQAMLAMRLGFASTLMRGSSAFLVLDDAFQHSDWPRRSNLVDRVVSIAESGWQVLYFTMDDHIRTLFLDAREGLGDRFAYSEL